MKKSRKQQPSVKPKVIPTEELVARAERLDIRFYPPVSQDAVWKAAEGHYRIRHYRRPKRRRSIDINAVLAYMRHKHSNYDALLPQLRNNNDAVQVLKQRVNTICREWLEYDESAET